MTTTVVNSPQVTSGFLSIYIISIHTIWLEFCDLNELKTPLTDRIMQTMAKGGKNKPPLRHEWQKTKVDKKCMAENRLKG